MKLCAIHYVDEQFHEKQVNLERKRERKTDRKRERQREREREKYTVAGQKHSDNREGTRLETTYHRINCIFLHHLAHSITHYGRKGYVLAAALTDVQVSETNSAGLIFRLLRM